MDIYTVAKKEADIKRQKEKLEREVLVHNMRNRESKMLEAFDDMGIIYEKSSWYRENTEQRGGRIEFKYDVFLTTDKKRKNSIEVNVGREDYKIEANWGNRFGCAQPTLDALIEEVVRYIKRANGC